jgi:hypothetical protein
MMTLVGQVLIFRSDRGAALTFLSWERYTTENIKHLQIVLERNTRAILNAISRAPCSATGKEGSAFDSRQTALQT